MSKVEKLLQHILNNQKNVQFNDLITLLAALGFERKRVSGSHHVFKHPKVTELIIIQPDQNSKAKPYQVRQLLKMIEAYGLRLESDQSAEMGNSTEENGK